MRGSILLIAALLAACNTRQKIAGAGAGATALGLYMSFSNEARAEDDVSTGEKVGIALVLTGIVTMFVAAALDEEAKKDEHRPLEIRVSSTSKSEPVDPHKKAAADRRAQAWQLTKQAQTSARAGDCAKVTELSAQVGALDAEFYSDVFMKDVAVQRCFVPAEPKDAPPAPPVPSIAPPAPSGS